MDCYDYGEIESLSINLPEDIQKKVMYGDIDGAKKLIAIYEQRDIPELLKKRLKMQKIILDVIYKDYNLTYQEAFAQLKELISDITKEEFIQLKDTGKIDWMYVNGEERYFRRYLSTLKKVNKEIRRRAGLDHENADELEVNENKALHDVIESIKQEKTITWHFSLRASVKINDASFRPGKVLVHLPIPAACQQITNIKIKQVSDHQGIVARENAPQRTICFKEDLLENKEFFVEYEYDNTVSYHELDPDCVKEIKTDDFKEELSESLPHLMFTPYLKSLAEQITSGIMNPLLKAKAIYDYITTKIEYSFMREYLTITNITEYVALSGKGDCGVQSLLFIVLCRISGIPARWQSGLYVTPYKAGSHDWAEFYIAPYGWLFADCSFGGGANREGNEEQRTFYFGNLDPFRMVANSQFQKEFEPPKMYIRTDPYDNQTGEIEYEDRGLLYDEYESEIKVLEAKPIR